MPIQASQVRQQVRRCETPLCGQPSHQEFHLLQLLSFPCSCQRQSLVQYVYAGVPLRQRVSSQHHQGQGYRAKLLKSLDGKLGYPAGV